MAKKKIKKISFPKIFHAHAMVTGFFAIAYVVLSVVYGPEFLLSDMRAKFQAVADEVMQVSARVLGPPQKPIVSNVARCDNGILAVDLDWLDDENSQYFDIMRNGLPLVTGIANSQYSDEITQSYGGLSYVITAHGWMEPGYAESDSVNIEVPAGCEYVVQTPVVKLVSVSGGKVKDGKWVTEDTRPVFSGTSNMSNATISITITGDMNYSAEITANANGYWSWRPPADLSYGYHDMNIIATDPARPERIATASTLIKINEKKELEDKEEQKPDISSPIKQKEIEKEPKSEIDQEPEGSGYELVLDYSLDLKDQIVMQGADAEVILKMEFLKDDFIGREAIVRYSIVDDKGEVRMQEYQSIILEKDARYSHKLNVRKDIFSGRYSLRSEVIISDHNMIREIPLEISDLPVIKLGGGALITYQEFLSQIGTVSIWLLIALLIWLAFLTREYWLSIHALRQITEESLRSMGMVPSRVNKGGV
jgi:hypothetical protein